jgi:riboflavin kinase/FMN adenylyltransferase
MDVEIIRLTYPFSVQPAADRQALAIGFFDGVHAGHREVLSKAVTLARRANVTASVMTFDPHPREVLGSGEQVSYITPLPDKLEQFAAAGLDRCYVLTFNRELSELSPESFVREILLQLGVKSVVVGFNFTYGKQGRGNAESLREYGKGLLDVSVIRPIVQGGAKVSSTLIREMIHQGSMDRVTELLGRPYRLTANVVPGLGRGRTIGVPTANLAPTDRYVIPGNGVYAVDVLIGDERHRGVMNIGTKPTFADDPQEPTLEVHVLGFSGDLYGRTVQVEFLTRIREERKFPGVEALVAQIRLDMEEAARVRR